MRHNPCHPPSITIQHANSQTCGLITVYKRGISEDHDGGPRRGRQSIFIRGEGEKGSIFLAMILAYGTSTTVVSVMFFLSKTIQRKMATKTDEIHEEELKIEEGNGTGNAASKVGSFCASPYVVTITQKLVAEVIGTYFIIFAGCGSVVVNKLYGETVTFPGICVTWGLIVMVMVYSLGHISGAHFNPAVTLTFAIYRHFPFKEVPLYMIAQVMGSILASCTLALMFDVTPKAFFGTVPVGSSGQSLAIEIIISFLLMFVISGVATDTRAIGELAGIAVGMTIMLNVFVAGPISGASMNPARSLGPALVKHNFKGLWVYIIGPPIGTIAGAFAYNLIRFTDKPLRELTKSSSFLKSASNR